MIAGATCVDDVVSVGLSFKCIPLTQHSWYSTPGFNWQAKKKKHVCTVRKNILAARPEIKQPAELWEAKEQRGETPGLQWTRSTHCGPHSSQEKHTDKHTHTNAYIQKYTVTHEHTTHRDTIFTFHLKKCIYCTLIDVHITPQTHFIMPALLDMQINKQQIHIMAATEKADHTVALSLSGESRNSQSEGSKAREWRRVWVSTNTQQKARKKKTSEHVWVDYNYTTS